MKNSTFREQFYSELNALMRRLEYTVIACAVRKLDHLAEYGVAALDPYLLSMDSLIEKFCFAIGTQAHNGVIVAERRDPTLDRSLELAWLNLKIQGTRHMQASEIDRRIISLNLRAKSDNIAGLQLADLVVTPIGRYVMGKQVKEDFEIIKAKFRHNLDGNFIGDGLVILPN